MSDPVRIVVGSSESAEIRIPESGLIVGPPGPAGEDGATFFPEVSEEGVISWTNDGGYDNPEPVNIKGPAGNDGSDGSDGEDGEDGVSPAVSFTTITGGHTMTVTDKDHPSGQSINIMDGEDGSAGADGTTFTPAVDASGNLSWTNDGGKQNPQTVNIKGPQGDPGNTGATPDLTIGTVSTLNAGSPATATITGTLAAPVLNLGIPQGPRGEAGAGLIYNNISGELAHFIDGDDGTDIRALDVNINVTSGITGAAILHTGKNLYNTAELSGTSYGVTYTLTANGGIYCSGTSTNVNTSKYKTYEKKYFPNGTYMLSGSTEHVEVRLNTYDENGDLISRYRSQYGNPGTAIITDAVKTVRLAIGFIAANTTVDETIYPQLEYGSSVSAFEPYEGTEYNIAFPSAAGSVTEGTIDAINGTLTAGGSTYQLTPIVVPSKYGVNNIWSDAGSVNVTYCADTKLFINSDATHAKVDEVGIVITGKRPSMAVTAGQYVIVRNSTISGITDGLYTANAALSPSTDVTAANLTQVSNGGLNDIIGSRLPLFRTYAVPSEPIEAGGIRVITYTIPSITGYTPHLTSVHIADTASTYYAKVFMVWHQSGTTLNAHVFNTSEVQLAPAPRVECIYLAN